MTISIVIPTFGRPADLIRCLTAIGKQRRRPDQVLIAVRDDDRDTLAALAPWDRDLLAVEVLSARRSNASTARNRCLSQSTGEIVVMTDDDTVPRPDWLETIHRRFEQDQDLGALGGPDWPQGDELTEGDRPGVVGKVQWWGRRIGNHHKGCNGARHVEWLKGANMSFRRRALLGHSFGRMLRGRGAQFGEDVDLSLQVRRSGWKVTYDPAVAVDHFPGRLPSNVDHRRLADLESLFDASHNDSVMMLDYLTPARRVAFLLWGVLVGTRLLPGFVVALHQGLGQGDWSGWRRSRVVRRARWLGFRRWLADRRKADPAASPIPIDRKPPTICIVTHVVQPGDGQGRVILRLANHLLDRGHQLTLVASEVESALSERAGLTWIRVPVPHRVPHALRWIWFAIVARLKLTRSLRQTFDVVHLNGAIVPVPADLNTAHFVHATWRRIAAKAPRLSLYQRFLARVCAATEAMAFRSARMVTAVSDAVERSLVRDVGLAARVVRVVYNGVDTVEFRPREPGEPSELRQELGLVGNEFLVLFVGDAKTSRKNLDCAIEAISRLPDRFHLAVIGAFEGGPYPNRAKSLGVSHRVRFLGLREDVAVCLRGGDLLFCASRYDPASLVLLEGLASGVPILSCPDVGNAAFIQSGKNGFLIEDWSDVAGAVRVIRALDLDPRRAAAVGEAGRETALELSWERMGAHYECLYQALLVPRVTGDVGRLPPERTLALPVEAQR